MVGDYLNAYTYDYLLKQGLAGLPDTVDKRSGSVVYDAIAGTAKLLAQGYEQMKQIYTDTFAQYATGEPLELRAIENGVKPKAAVKAVRKGIFTGGDGEPYDVPIGARFSAIDGANSINYKVTEQMAAGLCQLEAETAGTIGNSYLGAILPIDALYNLKSATLADIIIPGSDEETDESLRARYFDEKNAKRFGGNLVQYRSWITDRDGIGACQIYPVWNGGGTVKISVVDSQYNPLTEELLNEVQQAIDPTQDGQGLGTAPIGHRVTVTTPEAVAININAAIQIAAGFTTEQLKPLIEAEISAYIDDARIDWGTPASYDDNDYALYVFRSQIMAAILRVRGILNVTHLSLNDTQGDIALTETAALQQIPKLGVVTLA